MIDAGILDGDIVVVPQAETRRERRHRRRARRRRRDRRRGDRQALLPRGRPHPPPARERRRSSRSTRSTSRSSARSPGCSGRSDDRRRPRTEHSSRSCSRCSAARASSASSAASSSCTAADEIGCPECGMTCRETRFRRTRFLGAPLVVRRQRGQCSTHGRAGEAPTAARRPGKRGKASYNSGLQAG